MDTQKLYENGRCAYDNERYEDAYFYFLEAALSGDADSMMYLGCMYLYDAYVDRDYKKAFHFFKESMDLGRNFQIILFTDASSCFCTMQEQVNLLLCGNETSALLYDRCQEPKTIWFRIVTSGVDRPKYALYT